jgi:hypothetical protein
MGTLDGYLSGLPPEILGALNNEIETNDLNPVLTSVELVTIEGVRTQFSTITSLCNFITTNGIVNSIIYLPANTYNESFTIPPNTSVVGLGTRERVIIEGSGSTGTRITMSTGSVLENVTIKLPTDATPAISNGTSTSSTIRDVRFIGQGGSGIAVKLSGTTFSTMSITNWIYSSGNCDSVFVVDNTFDVGGVKSTLSVSVGNVVLGTINNSYRVLNGVFNGTNIASVSSGVTNALKASNTAVVEITDFIAKACSYGIYIDGNITMTGNSIRCSETATKHVYVDPSVTTANIKLNFSEFLRDRIEIPTISTISITFQDNREDSEALSLWSELSLGDPAIPRISSFGEGAAFTDSMVVITTDNTAGPTSDGGNLTDVSAIAASPSGSTVTFQGLTANHSILFGVNKLNGGDYIKHWGLEIIQIAAAVEITPKSFVFEVWDGAAWVIFPIMDNHSILFYRYGNSVFIRANTRESIRYGLTSSSIWNKKVISSKGIYWSRIRLVNTISIVPTFQQFKMSSSRATINGDGTSCFYGNSRYRESLISSGNIFGESGVVIDASINVGSGGLPTEWTHIAKNCNLNNNGDAVYVQGNLPQGICTSCPIIFRATIKLTTVGVNDATVILSVLPVEVVGNLVADPAGGVTPLARTVGNTKTLTSEEGLTSTKIVSTTDGTRLYYIDFDPMYVDDYYEGDMFFARVELDNDGITTNADIAILSLELSVVKWTLGQKL